uniref:Uncharacterized protein n=1 Tax=Eutreptiella gymnastica TaxID=73025 RepID=A0A7S1J1C2_9EUGL|mmetsp:Transcript_57958/g.103494  ORF Transcript_57958/g.103494 Transcript_57958/m.103494 type:complete len:194 (+) Transcript_57958:207-788(+)
MLAIRMYLEVFSCTGDYSALSLKAMAHTAKTCELSGGNEKSGGIPYPSLAPFYLTPPFFFYFLSPAQTSLHMPEPPSRHDHAPAAQFPPTPKHWTTKHYTALKKTVAIKVWYLGLGEGGAKTWMQGMGEVLEQWWSTVFMSQCGMSCLSVNGNVKSWYIRTSQAEFPFHLNLAMTSVPGTGCFSRRDSKICLS